MPTSRNIKAVIFDIDDTLTTRNSWNFLAVNLGVTDEEERRNWTMYKNGHITKEEADKRVLEMWTGRGMATKDNFRQIFSSIPLRPDAIDVINYLKNKNIVVCLITGSMDMYADIIAHKLGVNDFYSNTELFWGDDNIIKGFDYKFNQAELKLEQFVKFCDKYKVDPKECAVVGDSYNDYKLFEITGNGIAVRTQEEDESLEGIAWKIINELTELKGII